MEFILEQRRVFLDVAESLLHTPYIWGGDDPSGFDCSGMVIECLRSVGHLEKGHDYTADGLWNKYKYAEVERPRASVMAFWFNDSGRATHVAICRSSSFCITADGGGSKTKSTQDAIDRNAFIKIRPIHHGRNKPKYVDIFDDNN